MKKVLGDKQGGGGQREREGRPRGAKRERHPVFRGVSPAGEHGGGAEQHGDEGGGGHGDDGGGRRVEGSTYGGELAKISNCYYWETLAKFCRFWRASSRLYQKRNFARKY